MDLSIMPFAVSIPIFVLIGFTIFDIVRRSDLAALRKALWMVAVIVLPVVGTFLYLLARPFQDPAHQTLRGNDRTHAIIALLQQHAAGSISDDEFASAKHRVFDEAMAAHRAKNA
jgi:hypothetical protein